MTRHLCPVCIHTWRQCRCGSPDNRDMPCGACGAAHEPRPCPLPDEPKPAPAEAAAVRAERDKLRAVLATTATAAHNESRDLPAGSAVGRARQLGKIDGLIVAVDIFDAIKAREESAKGQDK